MFETLFRDLPLALYECGTVSPTVSPNCKNRLRVFRKTFEPKSEVLAEMWRKLHDMKISDCTSRNDILVIKLRRTK